mgnify:CR=1 FL=1
MPKLFTRWNVVEEIWETHLQEEVSFIGEALIQEYLQSILDEVSRFRPHRVLLFDVKGRTCRQMRDQKGETYLVLKDSQVLYGSFIIDTSTQRFQRFYQEEQGYLNWREISKF